MIYKQISQGELHRLRFELNRRNEEISDLQKALSESHGKLHEERDHLLKVYADYDELRLKEISDRRRLTELMQLQGKGSTAVKDRRPSTAQPQTQPQSLKVPPAQKVMLI